MSLCEVSTIEKSAIDLSIYPNPSKGIINIDNNSNLISNIEIINTLGQTIKSYITNKSISVELEKGVYIVKIKNEEETISRKIVIE